MFAILTISKCTVEWELHSNVVPLPPLKFFNGHLYSFVCQYSRLGWRSHVEQKLPWSMPSCGLNGLRCCFGFFSLRSRDGEVFLYIGRWAGLKVAVDTLQRSGIGAGEGAVFQRPIPESEARRILALPERAGPMAGRDRGAAERLRRG